MGSRLFVIPDTFRIILGAKMGIVPPNLPSIEQVMPDRRSVSKFVREFVELNKPSFLEFILKNTREYGSSICIDMTTKKHAFVASTIHFITQNWLV